MRARRTLTAIAAALALAVALPALAEAATTITVNTEADNAPNVAECLGLPMDCSLRQAIDKAVDDDTIALPAGHYTVASTLDVNSDISIAGTSTPVIDGGHAVRVFRIDRASTTNMSGVTVTGGNAAGDAGGAFLVPGTLNLTNSTITDSDALDGAAIALTNLESAASTRIVGTTISGNRAERNGGAIWSGFGDATLINSTVTGNTAGSAAVDGRGGGIYLEGLSVHIYNSTIVDNTAVGAGSEGGNLFIDPQQEEFAAAKPVGDPQYLLKNSIVAGGTATSGPNCGGDQPASQGNNLVNTSGECGTSSGLNDMNGSPGISALQDSGGPTLTRKLLPGSKAIDNGNASGCVDDNAAAITTDQRGVPRPIGAHCDTGAVEFAPPLAVTGQPNNVTKASATITGDVSNLHVKAGTSHFEFGTSTAYGQTFDAGAVAAGASHDPRTQGVTGLSPNTLYHYRIVVQNDDDTSFGKDVTFITPTDPSGPPEPTPTPTPTPTPKPKPHKPTVRAARASTGCVRSRFGLRLSVHVSSTAKLRSADVLLDGHRIKRTTHRRFSVKLSARRLSPGMHVLRVVATDTTGRKTTLRRLFRRCRVHVAPAFTG